MAATVPLRLRLFVFLGALLLFGLEPLVGRLLLPACGGGHQVWATCLAFFQGGLLLGYLYCHLLAPRLGRWHLLLLALPLGLLPFWVQRGASGLQPDPGAPMGQLLVWLSLWVALPFVAVSTTGVVAQSWLAAEPGEGRVDPYPLYAVSNAGSLLALFCYPLLAEPLLGLRAQRLAWTLAYLLYLVLAAVCVPRGRAPQASPPAPEPPAPEPPAPEPPLSGPDPARPVGAGTWLLLSAAPSAFLVAVTNEITIDVGSVPLLWVIPLAIYLASFVLVFGRRRWVPRAVLRFWPEAALVGCYFALHDQGGDTPVLAAHLLALGFLCLAGHEALYQLRPPPAQLTRYYLFLALGGWLGGTFAGLLAPVLFQARQWEYPLAAGLLAATQAWRKGREGWREWSRREPPVVLLLSLGLVVLVGLKVVADFLHRDRARPLASLRNFYGIYRVLERPASDDDEVVPGRLRELLHGTTLHGKQLTDPALQRRPLGYYHRNSPLADLMALLPAPRRVGVIGLGAGASAAYLERGDSITFYELDPDQIELARTWFSYLRDAQARGVEVRVVPGDARLSLEREPDLPGGGYQLLLVDAFSSDAIPTHLLTREALLLYASRLAPQGLLGFHISSRWYDLRPVIHATAAGLLDDAYKSGDLPDPARPDFQDPSDYAALRRAGEPLADLRARGWSAGAAMRLPAFTPWSDDYANVLAPLWLHGRLRWTVWWRGLRQPR